MDSPRSRTFSRGQIARKHKNVDEEKVRLREMLQQSLSREADTLRKLKHLQMKYLELLSKTNGCRRSPNFNEKRAHFLLNSTPEGTSTHNGSSPTSSLKQQSNMSNDDSVPYNAFPQLIVQPDIELACPPVENGIDNKLLDSNGLASLAPLPQGLRDVKQEREKPPWTLEEKKEVTSGKEDYSLYLESTRSLASTRQKSFSDESINNLHRLFSEPSGSPRTTGRSGTFWRRKTRVIEENEEIEISFDHLFKRFMSTSCIQPDPLEKYLDEHWSNVCIDPTCTIADKKYRDAVWEIFQKETSFLTCQLLPLEQVYKHFLEELQFHGILCDVNIDRIFGNLSELIALTNTTTNDLLKLFERRSHTKIAPINELILTFSMFGHNFNPVYKSFCTNYDQQRSYMKELEKQHHFREYMRVCRTAPYVQKNSIHDLLITPMQHQVHYKLLLENVLKHTTDPSHRSNLSSCIQAFKVSLQELNSTIAANKTTYELKELIGAINWPLTSQQPVDTYIPTSVSEILKQEQQKCANIITIDTRYLVIQGSFKLLDSKGKPYTDIQLILLSDLLLVTEVKKRQSNHQYDLLYQPFEPRGVVIHRPPNIRPLMTLIPHSSLGQQLCVFSLVSTSLEERDKWISELLSMGASLV